MNHKLLAIDLIIFITCLVINDTSLPLPLFPPYSLFHVGLVTSFAHSLSPPMVLFTHEGKRGIGWGVDGIWTILNVPSSLA